MNYKSIFQSTTFWGSIAALVSMLFPHVYSNIVGDSNPVTVVSTIVGVISTGITIYGRFTATQPVTITGAPPTTPPTPPTKGSGD